MRKSVFSVVAIKESVQAVSPELKGIAVRLDVDPVE